MAEAFIEKLNPAPLDGGFRREDDWVWCGSVIRDDAGSFHMFASMWTKAVPFNPNWLTNSRVVHAVSDTAAGPYVYKDDVLPPRGREWWDGMMSHNPTIHRSGGKYLLFYTGTAYAGAMPTDETPVSPQMRLEARANQRIGLAVADSPNGPWTRPDRPCVDVRARHWDSILTTNPAPCVLADGRILMLYKSTGADDAPIQYGVATAEGWDKPFERLGADEPIAFEKPGVSYEDAYIWHQDGRFRMIFNDMTGTFTGEDHAGAHAQSEDGIRWRLSDPPKAYSRTVKWADGSVSTQGSFERPQLLLQDGVPSHLFAATADGPGGFSRASHTWNMVVPLAR